MNNNYLTTAAFFENENKYANYLVFCVNSKQYALHVTNVIEVINLPQVDIPTNTPLGVIGIINYNDVMIKVVDICPFLGFETQPFDLTNQLIIVCVKGQYFAIRVDSIINISQFEAKDIHPIPFKTETSILGNVFKTTSEMISIVDIEKVDELLEKNENELGSINYEQLFPNDEKSLKILSIRAEHIKKHSDIFSFPVNINSNNQFILFTLENQNYYLDLKYVKEFNSIKRLNITKLPYTQPFIRGIVNLKGDFLIVIDLKKFLNNNAASAADGSKLIIVNGKNFNIALLVDDIKYIKNLKNSQITNKTMTSTSDYVSGEFVEDDILYNVLNFEKFINDERLYINVK